MEKSFKYKGQDIMLSVRLTDDTHGFLVDSGGEIVQRFVLEDDTTRLEDGNSFDESEESVLRKIDTLRLQAIEQVFTGIENESDDTKTVYANDETDPFNPDEISIDTKPVTMETLLRRLEQKTIRLNPDFQRQEVWDDVRKSQLIESLLLKIPIPMFYVSSDEKANWTVVDGLQRISSFRDFILGENYMKDREKYKNEKGDGMRLTGLEFWKTLNGKTMNELPSHLYNRILETVFTFTIVNPGTHEEVKRNIFKRLNTGGMPLSSQEIRNALYTGPSTKLLNELAETQAFKDATCNSIHVQRMEDRELVLRFLAFLVREPSTYIRTFNIDTWLSDTMIILNALPSLDSRELKKCVQQRTVILSDIANINFDTIRSQFALAMHRAEKLFGRHAFRKSTGDMRRSPINKSLFETWSVLLTELSEDEFENLCRNKDAMTGEYCKILENPDFEIAISRDSMRHGSVSRRFNELKMLIHKYIQNL